MQSTQWEYDTEGKTTQSAFIEKREYLECKEEGCALWVDGACRYNGNYA